jgi:phosphatidate cytidylyltransferase
MPDHLSIFMACMIFLMFSYVFTYPKYQANQIMAAYFGFFYVAVMLSFVYQIRELPRGLYLAFLGFLCSWGCDTCAYCVGKLIGKHKMSPKLSPKKSVEGAVGGVAGSALLTALYSYIFRAQMDIGTREIVLLAVIAAIAGLISMVGDLTASAIKRNYDIKDYGNLIPGHGGILDRFDSMIITAPIIYYLALYAL